MTDPRPAPMFLADAPGLDFLNTVAAPAGSEIEWLRNGPDLLTWLGQAGLAPADILARMRIDTLSGELDGIAAEARALREWFRGFVHAHVGRPVGPDTLAELDPLSRLLQRDEIYGAIIAPDVHIHDGAAHQGPAHAPMLEWQWRRRWRTPDTLLLPIAQAMADVICNADFTHVKNCEGPTCTMMFLDTSKQHARRWCSMSLCGNRAKQATHRARVKSVAGR